jgi:hypothetical protein
MKTLKLLTTSLSLSLSLFACAADDARWQKGDTLGVDEACTVLAQAACARAQWCFALDQQVCEQQYYTDCCVTEGTCGYNLTLNRDLMPCLDAWESWDCQRIEQGLLPGECLGI